MGPLGKVEKGRGSDFKRYKILFNRVRKEARSGKYFSKEISEKCSPLDESYKHKDAEHFQMNGAPKNCAISKLI